jgi:hypothetical protein
VPNNFTQDLAGTRKGMKNVYQQCLSILFIHKFYLRLWSVKLLNILWNSNHNIYYVHMYIYICMLQYCIYIYCIYLNGSSHLVISFLLASPKKWALNGGPWGEGIQFVHVWVVEWYISLSNHLIVKMCVTASGILILRISVWFEVVLYITITAANNLYVIMYIACRSASVKQWRMNKGQIFFKGTKTPCHRSNSECTNNQYVRSVAKKA